MRRHATLTAALALTRALAAQAPAGDGAHVVVGANVLVSRDDGAPHVELSVAAHPRDARRLIGTGIVVGDLATHNAVYTSGDGGASWASHVFTQNDGFDPLVAF